MSVTLLVDLDDTLLVNPIDQFLPAYLQKLSTHLADYADPSLMIQALMEGTRQMAQNNQPDCSLKDVFDSFFFPFLKIRPQDLNPAIDQFYVEVFPTLKALTQPKPGAIEFVEAAFERGYHVAITTNPLFPLTANVQRLEWAGLSPKKYPFALITSYETFHFSKPNPAYFAESLARLGWPEDPILVVGDDLKRDILCAQRLGVATYWVTSDNQSPQEIGAGSTGFGDLTEVIHWLDRTTLEALKPHFIEPDSLLAILRSTPAALNSLCFGLDPAKISTRPNPDEWSPTEILCHLRDVDGDVNLLRLRKVLQGSNPFIPGVDSDRWAEERDYLHQDGHRALQHFSATRQRVLRLLEKIAPQDWSLTARHAIFGPTQVKELVKIIAEHDQIHVRQMINALNG